MAGTGFHRDVANGELDIQLDGTVVCTLTTTSIVLPTGPITVGGRGTVTQLTNQQTGVAVEGLSGIITLFNANLAAAAESEFEVTNTLVGANDVVVVCVGAYLDGGGEGFAVCSDVGAAGGTFKIVLYNPSGADAFADSTTINFAVIKSAA